jgi:hypothetical protein
MPLQRYAFLVKGPGYSPQLPRAELPSPHFHTTVIGVSSLQEAIEQALTLAAEGIQLIELCGGFRSAEAQAIREALAGRIPIGLVSYSEEECLELEKRFQ